MDFTQQQQQEIARLDVRAFVPLEMPLALIPHLSLAQWTVLRNGIHVAVRKHYCQTASLVLLILIAAAGVVWVSPVFWVFCAAACCMAVGTKSQTCEGLDRLCLHMRRQVPALRFTLVRQPYRLGQLSIRRQVTVGPNGSQQPDWGGFLVSLVSYFLNGHQQGWTEPTRRMLTQEQVDQIATMTTTSTNTSDDDTKTPKVHDKNADHVDDVEDPPTSAVLEPATTAPEETADSQQQLCAICLDDWHDDDDDDDEEQATQSNRLTLPCRHVFHKECITEWLTTRKANCPLCNDDLYARIQPTSSSSQTAATSTSTLPSLAQRMDLAVAAEQQGETMEGESAVARQVRMLRTLTNMIQTESQQVRVEAATPLPQEAPTRGTRAAAVGPQDAPGGPAATAAAHSDISNSSSSNMSRSSSLSSASSFSTSW